ncbi:EF-hand domain-containing protein [Halocynthiibacter styelae]|uniref:Calcium-binding protein n=1 Tax=Halocynthiibacter styelae TaxID=2761955 RepID=A0A8J7LVA4_9RHOB|nr:EF-hand domain-containing protein [Paenihalocynthiibacter styelae]MBI1493117.1 calcium-binding protein [Paenihalocynthiibacter styelae]
MKGKTMKMTRFGKLTSDATRLWATTGAIALGLMITAVGPVAAGPHGDREPVAFSDIDANGDGEITEAEFTAHRAAKRTERFETTDTNNDGLLSEDEIKEAGGRRAGRRASRMIDRFDANDDGMLSMDELPEHGQGHRGGDDDDRESFMERFDEDNNGSISEAEFEAAKEHMQERRGRNGRHQD